ncbi:MULTISPECIES: 1-phosphofructokinase [unclassified Romboutsia]|uniref:1-phosphofructokinase n=1 Tax=unclassified Romboutsia TaxID=2626894 RepID=UPI000820A4EC|nr:MULTISPECIES: 1-phosphofructokinase [unclassified Romboutsia]SCI40302.1 Tagatose-6-phosphate kinase [uncultured Clostridium sp.]
MIYTVTLNPAIDYLIKLDSLNLGSVNRVEDEKVYAGGKGINVSNMLQQLDCQSTALGFVSGFTGDFIIKSLEEKGIENKFIKLKNGFTRINVKIKGNEETEINGQGPLINENELNELYKIIDELNSEDILVLAGSIPSTLSDKLYENIMERIKNKEIKVVVDATKSLLLNVLKYKPFLIKPNNHELEEIFNVKLSSNKDIIKYANKLKEMGARNVLVSMGKEGALLVTENGDIYTSNVAKGEVKNSVGAGDSMVAGFLSGYVMTNKFDEALKQGAACGGATAFSYDIATREFIDEVKKQIIVEKI